MSTDTTIQ